MNMSQSLYGYTDYYSDVVIISRFETYEALRDQYKIAPRDYNTRICIDDLDELLEEINTHKLNRIAFLDSTDVVFRITSELLKMTNYLVFVGIRENGEEVLRMRNVNWENGNIHVEIVTIILPNRIKQPITSIMNRLTIGYIELFDIKDLDSVIELINGLQIETVKITFSQPSELPTQPNLGKLMDLDYSNIKCLVFAKMEYSLPQKVLSYYKLIGFRCTSTQRDFEDKILIFER